MKLELRPGFALFAALIALLCDELAPAFFLALIVHETAHLAAAALLHGRLGRITLGFADCRIEAAFSSYAAEAACALAGPIVNLLACLLFRRIAPAFAALSLLLGSYNLLPVWPLDGGRWLLCVLCTIAEPERAWAIVRLCGLSFCAVLLALCLAAGSLWRLGLWPLAAALLLFSRLALAAKGESSCFFP